MNKSKTEGFFTSSRDGGAGGDDIYRFKIKDGLDEVKPTPALPIDICVYDDASRERLKNAELKIKRVAKQEVPTNSYVTNEYGYTSCEMRAGEQYIIDVIRYGYRDMDETFIMPNTVEGLDEFCIGLERDPKIPIEEVPAVVATNDPNKIGRGGVYINTELNTTFTVPNYKYDPEILIEGPQVSGQVVNTEYNRPLPRAQVKLLNRCTGEELIMEVGTDGKYAFPLDCGCEYVIKSNKNRFVGDNQVISLVNEAFCDNPIELNLDMTPDFDMSYGEGSFSEPILENLKEGDVIELKNIYYDYDKANIRKDAARDLDDLIKLMKQYPSMEIELSSHTDIRGSDAYNERLSDDRAKSAQKYLVAGGIEESRIDAKGYGENRLKNECKFCTESDHQQNRRTEVQIIKLQR
jgi:outer membrane protein OmpA-like peptidoglycan-associated protein